MDIIANLEKSLRMTEGFKIEAFGNDDLLLISEFDSISLSYLLSNEIDFIREESQDCLNARMELFRIRSALFRLLQIAQTKLDEMKLNQL